MAKRKRTRPKGYAEWDPKPETEVILEQVYRILADYVRFLPLTVRQIFYILVGVYGFPKTENAYGRITEYLVWARRSGLIPFEHIRDESDTR